MPVVEGRRPYFALGHELKEVEFGEPLFQITGGKDRKGKPTTTRKLNVSPIWSARIDAQADLIRAGDKLLAARGVTCWQSSKHRLRSPPG